MRTALLATAALMALTASSYAQSSADLWLNGSQKPAVQQNHTWPAPAGNQPRPVVAARKTITIETLTGAINPQTVGKLGGLSCRNLDKIVHVDIWVDWPSEATQAEKSGFERLTFWTHDGTDFQTEYLFPKGSYFYLHGSWMIKGYFIVRSGGMHQGTTSIAFERIDDAQVLNPNVREIPARGDCK